jgi:dihydrofolate reductase
MSIKASVFIAMSLDGFIARKDGSLDWLDSATATAPKGEDCGYQVFMDTVDVLVMGRNTYEKVLTFCEWPYKEKAVVVMSSQKIEIPARLQKTVSSSSEQPTDLCERLSAEGAKHLYIDGGVTIQRFLKAGLIDDITITLIPVILGEGIPLFGPINKELSLTHVGTQSFDFGCVQVKYSVRNIKA